jgi:Family of unknown function (DUF5906)
LFADECFAPQDKAAEGMLKRLITEPTLQIEAKGRDSIEEPNRLHVMLASNNDWVVPAGNYERRFVAQRVADTHLQDKAWFDPIYKQLRCGGLEAMLFDLLERDLGDWHPRRIVRTAALAEPQERSLSPLDSWWFELLQTGILGGADFLNPDRPVSNHYDEEVEVGTDGYGGKRTRIVRREGERRGGGVDLLWSELHRPVPTDRRLCRQDSARNEARGPTGGAADQVRAGCQSGHGDGARA